MKQTYAPASKKLAPGRSSRRSSSRAMVTENRPNKNSSSAKMANRDSDGIARSGGMTAVVLPVQRQSSHAPPASSSSSSTANPGTKNFSNCSRARRAGKTSDVLRFKQRGLAPAAGEFLHLQFFQPLVFLQPHLEPARKRHQRAQAEEDRGGLAGQRVA